MKMAGASVLIPVIMTAIGCTATTPSSANLRPVHIHQTTVIAKAPVKPVEQTYEPTSRRTESTDPPETVMPAKKTNPYTDLSAALAKAVEGNAISVTVGNFVFEGTEQMSAFSAMLRKELELELPKTGKFRIATRERLAELLEEDGLYDAGILDPGANSVRMKLEDVSAIVRGSFHYEYPRVTVYAQLAWLNGSSADSAKIVVDAREIHTRILPIPEVKKETDTVVRPHNMDAGQTNVKDVKDRIKKIPRDFGLYLAVAESKRDFAEGETISYTIRSDKACHIAVFCHQVDGSTVVLFPNRWSVDSRISARERIRIPGSEKKGFEIMVGPPFGADVVQVIGCTKRSALHRMVEECARKAPAGATYRGLTRGQFSQGISGSFSDVPDPNMDAPGPTRWSEAHVVVSTYPRFAR